MNGDVFKPKGIDTNRTYVEIGRFDVGGKDWVRLMSVDEESSLPDMPRVYGLPLSDLVQVKSRYEGARCGRCGE